MLDVQLDVTWIQTCFKASSAVMRRCTSTTSILFSRSLAQSDTAFHTSLDVCIAHTQQVRHSAPYFTWRLHSTHTAGKIRRSILHSVSGKQIHASPIWHSIPHFATHNTTFQLIMLAHFSRRQNWQDSTSLYHTALMCRNVEFPSHPINSNNKGNDRW